MLYIAYIRNMTSQTKKQNILYENVFYIKYIYIYIYIYVLYYKYIYIYIYVYIKYISIKSHSSYFQKQNIKTLDVD